MASTYLNKTLGTPTNNKIWTFSAWVKRGNLSGGNSLYPNIFCANSLRDCIRFLNGNNLQVFFNEAGSGNLETNAKYRDVNAWYHIVVAVDTTQATASNRVKIYVNGEQVTSFSTETYPAQNYTNFINSAIEHRIGKDFTYTNEYFDGSMSHIHFVDGTQYQASDFGETDSTTGEWKIKTSVSVTYGNNGFFILKDGNSVTDQSGNSNNFTVASGTLTNTEDNPSNVFATYNPLFHACGNLNFYNGNTLIEGTGSNTWTNRWAVSTLGMTGGKFYCEVEVDNDSGGNLYPLGFIQDIGDTAITTSLGGQSNGWGVYADNGQIYHNGSVLETVSAITDGDIVACALDTENGTAQFYLNGSTYGSQITSLSTTSVYHFMSNFYGNGNTLKANFGNGYFGTTAISSEGTNASGIGKFEYDVPTGYTALSTKGLNE